MLRGCRPAGSGAAPPRSARKATNTSPSTVSAAVSVDAAGAGRPRARPAAPVAGSARPAGPRSRCGAGPVTSPASPACTTRPSSTMTSRSASTIASSGSWVTSTVAPSNDGEVAVAARPGRPAGCAASSAASGSSSSSSRGSAASARASATRWACPPESWRGLRPACSASPTRSSQSAARSRASPPGDAAGSAARRRRCPARSGAGRAGSPGTPRRPGAAPARAGRRATGRRRPVPSSRIRPVVERHAGRPARAARCVLPAPFGPSSATTSPGCDGQRDVEVEAAAVARRRSADSVEPRHRRRREPAVAQPARMATETTSSTRLQHDRRVRVVLQGQVDGERHGLGACRGSCRRR